MFLVPTTLGHDQSFSHSSRCSLGLDAEGITQKRYTHLRSREPQPILGYIYTAHMHICICTYHVHNLMCIYIYIQSLDTYTPEIHLHVTMITIMKIAMRNNSNDNDDNSNICSTRNR
jgi:hypothetical protein